jgi:hypothetical protein
MVRFEAAFRGRRLAKQQPERAAMHANDALSAADFAAECDVEPFGIPRLRPINEWTTGIGCNQRSRPAREKNYAALGEVAGCSSHVLPDRHSAFPASWCGTVLVTHQQAKTIMHEPAIDRASSRSSKTKLAASIAITSLT